MRHGLLVVTASFQVLYAAHLPTHQQANPDKGTQITAACCSTYLTKLLRYIHNLTLSADKQAVPPQLR
jgi:hypothetical protein